MKGNMPLILRTSDGTPRDAIIDLSSHAVVWIDYEHHKIHAAKHFFLEGTDDMGNGEVNNFVVEVPATPELHMVFQVFSAGDMTMDVYETITANADGTVLTPIANNRNNIQAANGTFRLNPTGINTAGATFSTSYRSGTAGGFLGAGQQGGAFNRGNELILKASTKYLWRFTSNQADNWLSYVAEWYEETPRG